MSASVSTEQGELIKKIMSSPKLAEIVNLDKLKEDYKSVILQIHPDRCSHPDASSATAKLNQLKDRYENGVELKDEAGAFNTNDYVIRFKGDKAALDESLDNYNRLKKVGGEAGKLISRQLPFSVKFEGNELIADMGISDFTPHYKLRVIPLTGLTLPQEHVNWIFSRVLEFASLMEDIGYSHMGMCPESVFIMPDEHLIKITSLYHMTRLGSCPKTFSAPYRTWYPEELFDTRKTSPLVDVQMAKKLAIYLLGDKSGVGIRLTKTHNEAFMNFILSEHETSKECFIKYREMIKANFEKKFYTLSM